MIAQYVLLELAAKWLTFGRLIQETQKLDEHAIRESITERSEIMGFNVSESVAKNDRVERVVYISVVDLRGKLPEIFIIMSGWKTCVMDI